MSFPGPDQLLSLLRGAGLHVGPREVERLRVVFELQPTWGDEELLTALRALLVRTPEEDDQLRRVWEAWQHAAQGAIATPTERPSVEPPVARPRRRWKHWTLAILAAVAVVSLVAHLVPEPKPPTVAPVVNPVKSEKVETPAAPTTRATHYTEQVPHFDVHYKWPGPGIPAGLLLLLGCAWVWRDLQRRSVLDTWLPKPAPPPRADGPTRLPPLPAEAPADRLPPGAARMLAWSVTRFVSEEPTEHLDLDRTVRRTATSGLFTPVYAPERHLREVWLWIDEASRAPGLSAYAAELRDTLRRAHVEVRVGYFWQVPDEVRWETGEPFRPATVEGARETALVGVLTDGRGLAAVRRLAYRQADLAQLFRGLAEWPRMVFADFGDGSALLPSNLRCVHPDALPAALGAMDGGPRELPDVSSQEAWKGAMALSWQPVPEATGQALRAHLGLGVSPFSWDAGAAWRPDDRVRRLNRLARVDQGVLRGALGFWRARLEEEAIARRADGALRWVGSVAEQAWAMEVAFLELWMAPEDAARRLFPIYTGGSPLRDEIRDRLRQFGGIRLPWEATTLSAEALVMLGEMGMPLQRGRLAVPARIGVAKGMVGAVVVVGAGVMGWSTWEWVTPTLPDLPEGVNAEIKDGVARAWTARAQFAPVEVRWFEEAALTTKPNRSACESPAPDGGVILQCSVTGDESTWHALANWPKSALWWIDDAPTDDTRALAYAALDSGSADVVVVGPTLVRTVAQGQEVLRLTHSQLAVQNGVQTSGTVFVASWRDALAEVTQGSVIRALPWSTLPSRGPSPATPPGAGGVPSGKGDRTDWESTWRFRLAPMPAPPTLAWSSIPAGTFQMGSTDGNDDERPVHAVHVDAFDINTTEVTNAEYRHRDASHQENDTLPVVNVTWFEADAYCRWLGAADTTWSYRLPTEAEWEYAARGTDGRTYPWGNEAPDETRAVFNAGAAAPVGTHPAGQGPFGAQDQAGNVWEWALDWYGPYDPNDPTNPRGPAAAERRVRRGGSWYSESVRMRSADRERNGPSFSGGDVGFRCVRVPRPEP